MELISQCFKVNEYIVNIDELETYCKIHGIKNDGKARSKFIQAR